MVLASNERMSDTYLRGSHGRDIRTSAWETRIELARLAVGVSAVAWCEGLVNALTSVPSNAVVSGRVQNGDAHKTELHVFVALALLVLWSQICLVVAVRRRDDFGRGVAAAVLQALVAAVWVGIYTVLGWIVAAGVGAVTAIDCILCIRSAGRKLSSRVWTYTYQKVVEGCALNEVASLVKRDFLRVH